MTTVQALVVAICGGFIVAAGALNPWLYPVGFTVWLIGMLRLADPWRPFR